MKKAYTLVEILVVMVIVGVLTAMGVYAYNYFKKVVEINQSINSVASSIKETKNFAKNNSITGDVPAPDLLNKKLAYKIDVVNNTLRRSFCSIPITQNWDDSNLIVSCYASYKDIDLKQKLHDNVVFTAISGQCDNIIFENLTGKIIFRSGNSALIAKSCSIKVSYLNDNILSKIIIIDGINGNIETK